MVTGILVLALGIYCGLSFILLRWPTLLHKKKASKIQATVVCHRGGSGEFIENTIHAFTSAVEMGADMLEIDCQLTKDEEVVISHDNDLTRGTGVANHISDLNFDELPQYKDTLDVTFGFGRVCTAKEGVSRSIPLLRTVFERFPQVPINIDVKTDSDVLIKNISDLIEEFGRRDITVWGSFSDEINRKCRLVNPKIATFVPIKRTFMMVVAYYVGLLPFLPLPDGFYEVPLVPLFGRMQNVIDYVKSWVGMIPAFFKFGFSDDYIYGIILNFLDHFFMSRKLIDHLRARGLKVFFWVCNEEKDFDKAFSMGRVAIVTDYPSELLKYLQNHPEIERSSTSS
nr:glycerophosphodiester phosphodiesterase [Hymenolepis microstoma]